MSNVVMLHGGATLSQRLRIRHRIAQLHPDRWSLAAMSAVYALPEDSVKMPNEWVAIFDEAERVLRKTFGKRLLRRGTRELHEGIAAEGK